MDLITYGRASKVAWTTVGLSSAYSQMPDMIPSPKSDESWSNCSEVGFAPLVGLVVVCSVRSTEVWMATFMRSAVSELWRWAREARRDCQSRDKIPGSMGNICIESTCWISPSTPVLLMSSLGSRSNISWTMMTPCSLYLTSKSSKSVITGGITRCHICSKASDWDRNVNTSFFPRNQEKQIPQAHLHQLRLRHSLISWSSPPC